MSSKIATKMAQDLLDRFFRDGEGKTNRQIDVYFALEDLGVQRDKAEESLEYLSSRGLINLFGPDVAFLTELGVAAITEERDISKLPKLQREFVQSRPNPTTPPPAQVAPEPKKVEPKRNEPRLPEKPQLRYTDMSGAEHVVELGWSCTIGRVEGNTIHLDDQRASKKHAEVKLENGRYSLNDLGAANGTMLNGSYIDSQPLSHGDEILIGRTTLVFESPRVIIAPPKDEPRVPDDQATPLVSPSLARAPAQEIIRETERPSPSEPIRVVKGRPEPARVESVRVEPVRSQPVPMASSSNADLFDDSPKTRVPPFPGPSSSSRPQAKADPDDLFADSHRDERSSPRAESDDLFGDTAKRPKMEGDLFADTPDIIEPNEANETREPSAQDLFSEVAIQRPIPEAPSNLFDEEPNTVFARTDHGVRDRVITDAVSPRPLEPMENLEPEHLEPIEELDNISMLDPIDDPADENEPVSAESTLVNTSLKELAERSGVEIPQVWQGHDEHTPADQIALIPERDDDPATEQHSRADLLANAPVTLVPEADTEGATPRPSLQLKQPVIRSPSEDLPRWGEDLAAAPIGSHPSFAQGSQEHISNIEEVAAGEELPDASEELADLSITGLPMPAGLRDDGRDSGRDSVFHQTLRKLRIHVERANLPDRDKVLAALELLERHPYIRVALNLSEPDR